MRYIQNYKDRQMITKENNKKETKEFRVVSRATMNLAMYTPDNVR